MKTRVLTAVAALVPVLAAVLYGEIWPLSLLATAAFLVGSFELSAIARLPSRRVAVAALALCWFALDAESRWGARLVAPTSLLLLSILGVLAAASLRSPPPRMPRRQVEFEAGALWIFAPLAALVLVKSSFPAHGGATWDFSSPLLLALVPIWVGDTAAMLVGRSWGRTPLAPGISPKKTVEGAIANLLGCVAASAALGPWVEATWPAALGCGLACGTLGQAGDLFQSVLKRAADLKDSGSILPGHGGLLDRIDSLLFAAPAVALILSVPGAVSPRF